MKKLLAKDNGLSLLEHSNIVAHIGYELSKVVLNNNVFKKDLDIIKYSCLLHDIGKLTTEFQNKLNGMSTKSLRFRHNEIGWAFVSKYLNDEFENKDIILNSIYWHHGISNKLNHYTDSEILDSLDSSSIYNMLSYLKHIVGDNNVSLIEEDEKSPLFYNTYVGDELKKLGNKLSKLSRKQLILNIVISSDRISSEYKKIDAIPDNLIDSYFNLSIDGSSNKFENCKFKDTDRFNKQLSILNNDIGDSKTTMLKAPAGFGKTLLALMWAIRKNKKIMWVVPRNAIAYSVYNSIKEELKNLNINLNVQLLLAGEVIKSTDVSNPYETDIIVTNIDNYIAPVINNSIMNYSLLIDSTTVVFDEFQEFATESALMATFVNLMKIRHRRVNSNTLLASATPINMNFLWDTPNNKTLILPNSKSHYKAIHGKPYKVSFIESEPIVKKDNCSLVVCNSIKDSQKMKSDNFDKLLHSNFINETKTDIIDYIIDNYGKYSTPSDDKSNIVGTPILEASLDVSFKNVYDYCLSPESSIQRAGRCNRFGEYDDSEIIFVDYENKSNNIMKSILYDVYLSNKWLSFIKNISKITLDELYEKYNEFSVVEEDSIKNYLKKLHIKSLNSMSRIYPVKFNKTEYKDDTLIAGSNKLRTNDKSEIFILVKDINGLWVGPFNMKIYNSFDKEFNEKGNIVRKMIKSMSNVDSDIFDFGNLLSNKYKRKNISIDQIRRMSRKSNTPYFVYNMYYDYELGIVKK